MRKSFSLLLSVILLASILISCSKQQSSPASSSNDTKTSEPPAASVPSATGEKILYLAHGPDDKFQAAWADYGGFFKTALFRRLLMLNEKLEPVYKDLAKDYSVSPDGKTYTFTLRDDVKWHDGVPFTAEDVKWSLKMALKSASINSVFSGAFSKIVGAQDWQSGKADDLKGVTVEGDKLTIQLTEPVGVFPLVMAQWPPYPKHLLEKEDPAKLHLSSFWEKPIGNGPYMLMEVKPNNYAIMEVFKDYYGPKPKIEKIMLQTMKEDQVVTKTQANQLDYYPNMSLDQVNQILKNPAYKAYPVDILYIRYLQANMTGPDGKGNKKISDLRVRQALLHAIDRKAIADKLFPGQASVINTKIPPGLPEYNKNAVQYDYNPEKAKKLLQEANFDFSQPIKLQYYYTDQQTIDLIDTIKYYWEQIGVKVETSLMKGNLLELIYSKRDYDFLYAGLSAMSMEEVYGLFHTDSPLGVQVFGGAKDKWDPLIDQLRRTSDQKQRTEIVGKLQEMESQFLWHMPLFSLKQYVIVNESRLKTAGIYGNEWTNYDRKIQDWELKVK